MNRPWLWWTLVLGSLWLVFALCAYWEPVVGDGWGHVAWHRLYDVAPGTLWDEMVWGWKHNNPRPGQIVTLLLFTPGPWHVVVTPVVLIAMFVLLAALVLGRWPSVRSGDDLLFFVALVAIVGLCGPQFGPMLFYRPMSGNYTYTLALNLLWLVPYRFHLARRWWLLPFAVVVGFFAGFGNEHTGTAIAGAAGVATYAAYRRGDGGRVWMVAGIVAFLVGYALLLLAPGQGERYGGLANEASMLGRIVERGLWGNVRLFVIPMAALWPSLFAVAVAFVARRRSAPPEMSREMRYTLLVFAAAGAAVFATLLASPKAGHRLLFAGSVLWCAAIARWVTWQLTGTFRTIGAAVFGAGYAVVLAVLVVLYSQAGAVRDARMAALEGASPGSTVQLVDRYRPSDRWFFGEDLDFPNKRTEVEGLYNLAKVELHARD